MNKTVTTATNDNLCPEFAEIKDVEIFESGTYRGKTYTDGHLDEMVNNFNGKIKTELNETHEPPLVIGHDGKQSEVISGTPSVGRVASLKRIGKKLIADFVNVPNEVIEAIKNKAYTKRSASIYFDYKGLGHALRHVALLGGELPELKTLKDVASLSYADDDPETETVDFLTEEPQKDIIVEPFKGGEEDVDKEILKAKDDEIVTLKEKLSKETEASKTLAEEKQVAEAKAAEYAEKARKEEIKTKVSALKAEGKIAPVMEEKLMSFCESLDNVDNFGETEKSQLDYFIEMLNEMPKAIEFGEKVKVDQEKVKGGRDINVDAESYAEKNDVSLTEALQALASTGKYTEKEQ